MSDSLKKRWSLPDDVITHMFSGDAKENSFSGFHSEAEKSLENGKMQIDGQPNPVMLVRRDAGKTYKLKVKIKMGGGTFVQTSKESTFFPHPKKPGGDRWTKEQIVLYVEQSLTKHSDSSRSSREEWIANPRKMDRTDTGGVVEEIRINGIRCHVLYEKGAIASVYPADLDDASSGA